MVLPLEIFYKVPILLYKKRRVIPDPSSLVYPSYGRDDDDDVDDYDGDDDADGNGSDDDCRREEAATAEEEEKEVDQERPAEETVKTSAAAATDVFVEPAAVTRRKRAATATIDARVAALTYAFGGGGAGDLLPQFRPPPTPSFDYEAGCGGGGIVAGLLPSPMMAPHQLQHLMAYAIFF